MVALFRRQAAFPVWSSGGTAEALGGSVGVPSAVGAPEAWPGLPGRNRAAEGEGVVGRVVPDSAEDATEGRKGRRPKGWRVEARRGNPG